LVFVKKEEGITAIFTSINVELADKGYG